MPLIWAYHRFRTTTPPAVLGGRTYRPQPVIHVTLIGPSGTAIDRGLLDPGADDTVFTESVAATIGLDLTGAPQGMASGVAGSSIGILRYAEVAIRIATTTERREWRAWVGFAAQPLRRALLGYNGFLEFFDADFRGEAKEVELTVNGRYPGTGGEIVPGGAP
jgi:hypothetical protein